MILLSSFFIRFVVVVNFCELYEKGKVNIVSMLHFLETDIREQKMYEMRTQTSLDNAVDDLRYEIKFENCVKDKNSFLLSEILLFFLEQKYYSSRHIFLRFLKI